MGIKSPDVPVGSAINSWTVLEHTNTKGKEYRCKCVCGVEKLISKSNLRLGKSKSCGTGACSAKPGLTHGLSKHPLFSVWVGIQARLDNPTGANECYQGISLAPEWGDFQAFYDWSLANGYAAGLTIDREIRTGDYTPGNCRWVTHLVQSQNRGKHTGKLIPYKGVYKASPRKGKVLYEGTGKAPYYWIVIYDGNRKQKWGFATAEAAYQDRLAFIEANYRGSVVPE